jgi:hypothetical protein
MSTKLGEIDDIIVTQFWGGPRGTCIQIAGPDGYVQLDPCAVVNLVEILHDYLFEKPILESEEKL